MTGARIAISGWFWDQPYTGSGQVVRQIVAGLRRAAPELQLVLVLPGTTAPSDIPEGVETICAGGGRSNLDKVWFEQRRFPAAVARARADLAHVPYWGGPLSSPVPVVVSVLDVIPLLMPEYAPGPMARLYVSLQRAAARGASHIITISEAARADVVRTLGVPAERVSVTLLAADERFHPRLGAERDAAVREKYHLPERFVLYMGGFDTRKQVSQLISAYTFVARPLGDEVPLVLAGAQPAWGQPPFPDLPAEVAAAGLEHIVRWIGRVDEADKPALYRMAEVFAFPSRYEGFGLPVLEAMASGTPVVANAIPVIEEVAGEAAYLVRAESAREMGAAILSLLVDPALREDLSTRGLGQATRFQWRRTARETAAIYRRVLEAARPPAATSS